MNIAKLILQECALFAEQDVSSWELEPQEWNEVEKTFEWEGLRITFTCNVFRHEPAFAGNYYQPSDDYEDEITDIAVQEIEIA